MGVIPWGFESPLRHQVGRRGNGARVKHGEGEDMNAVRVRPVSTPLGAARRESKLPRARSALRQVPIPGFVFVKGGREPPFHTFPPVTRAANKFAAIIFCALGQAPLALTARRPGNAHQKNWADLRSASRRAGTGTPTSGRHSPPQAGGGKDPHPPGWPPLGVDPSSAGGAQARERRPPVGTARRRRADGKDPHPPDDSPLGVDPSSAGGAAGQGTPTSGPAQPAAGGRTGRTPPPRMARPREKGTPVSDRHRAGARNQRR